MARMNFFGTVIIVAAVAFSDLAATPSFAASSDKPNIILILTDDQGYGDLQRHGHPLLKTPHTNQFYDDSVRFENFYVSPSCSPTRAALLTGMHEFRNGVTHTLIPREQLFKDAVTLSDLLKTAGYHTGFIGKWHLGGGKGYAPEDRGFDWTATNPEGPRRHFDPVMIRNGVREQKEGFREDLFFDEAMDFIDDSGDKPFFCYLATYSPHTPLDAPEEFISPFREHVSEKHATYLGMVANIDYNVGRLTEFLSKRGLEKDTIVVFMNDNGQTEGLDVYNAGMRGCKCTVWEGGSKAMSFWKWPGHWKPHAVENLTAHLDVVPTLCELAGVKIPEQVESNLEGFSLLPLLESEAPISWHDSRLLIHNVGRWPSGLARSHKHAMCGVRQGHKLLIRSTPCDDPECVKFQSQCTTLRAVQKGLKTTTYTQGNAQFHWGASPTGKWVMFDVKADPACQNDIAASNPELVAELVAAYDNWWDELYPVMIARGGDEGDPNASAQAASRARQHAAMQAAKKSRSEKPARKEANVDVPRDENRIFLRMDQNADQKVTKDEFVSHFVSAFPQKDENGDGALSAAEFSYSRSFTAGDTDQNGNLSPAEFERLYSNQFDHRDANQDGVLTLDEM